jgi:hypothetical protein
MGFGKLGERNANHREEKGKPEAGQQAELRIRDS